MKTLGVILARAGSKGLPGKNLADLDGRPLLAWTIAHARAATGLDRIVVSTDGSALAAEATRRGIAVVERPAELANDTATVDSAARHAVETIERREGRTYDAVVILYGNVPLRPSDLIDRAVAKLAATHADSVQSVCPVGKMHPYWMKTLSASDSGECDVLGPYQPNTVYRRQDLPPVYMLDGGIIAVTRQSLFTVIPDQPHAFLGRDRRAVVTLPGQVVDIDTAADLDHARALVAAARSAPTGAPALTIAGKSVHAPEAVYVIAELGVNHDGSWARALDLTRAAHQAGADAVKLQLFDAPLLLSAQAELAGYQKAGAADPYEMLARLQLTPEAMAAVRDLAHALHMGFIVTCFSLELVDALRRLAVDAVKIASPDCVNLPLLHAVLGLGPPVLISTGAAELAELEPALRLGRGHAVALLQCVSAYPTPTDQASLGAIADLARLGVPVGYSDHTADLHTGAVAVACDAAVIEKHLTYDRQAHGPDHAASLDPAQFAHYVRLIRTAGAMIGTRGKQRLEIEQDVYRVSRQSVCALRDLPSGHVLRRPDITVKRPGTGIPAARFEEVIGQRLRRAVAANHLLRDEDLEPPA